MATVEQLVDDYVKCWFPQRPRYSGQWEDNDFGCEHLQIFRNNLNLVDFNHDELSRLATLLTRELRGQINRDHKFFWARCAFLTWHFKNRVPLFGDNDWQAGFVDLINLLLASKRRFPAGPVFLQFLRRALGFVNHHLLETSLSKWQISGPLTFSILEGLLRRKNEYYVQKNGMVRRRFSISTSHARTKTFDPSGSASQKWLNRISHSFRCFEQNMTVHRGRACPYLQQMKTEIVTLYPTITDVYDTFNTWRNDLIHGKDHWQIQVPILVDFVCLLIVDEIDPTLYNGQKADMGRIIEWHSRMFRLSRARWDIYPPDL